MTGPFVDAAGTHPCSERAVAGHVCKQQHRGHGRAAGRRGRVRARVHPRHAARHVGGGGGERRAGQHSLRGGLRRRQLRRAHGCVGGAVSARGRGTRARAGRQRGPAAPSGVPARPPAPTPLPLLRQRRPRAACAALPQAAAKPTAPPAWGALARRAARAGTRVTRGRERAHQRSGRSSSAWRAMRPAACVAAAHRRLRPGRTACRWSRGSRRQRFRLALRSDAAAPRRPTQSQAPRWCAATRLAGQPARGPRRRSRPRRRARPPGSKG